MHTTNYQSTLITASADCRHDDSVSPSRAGTIAALQHDLLRDAPYSMTSDDLLWRVEALRKPDLPDNGVARAEYFSTGRACLRASPLVKSFGWALHHDEDGHVALVDVQSPAYRQLIADDDVKKLPGMRSSRA